MVRKIRAKLVLRLRAEGLSGRAIAAAHSMSRRSVLAVFAAADREGVSWDDIAQQDDDAVYALLFPGRGEHQSVYAQPDWAVTHSELSRVGVTLKLLHAEYLDRCETAGEPAMGYDRFCKGYAQHVLIAGAASRVGHKAGQSIEVDWSGPTMHLTDPVTGQHTRVYLFVGCLPFSRYAFVEPTLDMRQDTWLQAHVAMFAWFGGSVPRIIPDNLKTGVIAHPREGEVVLNDSYRELAAHYSAAVLPARVKKPKDKPSVENTVRSIATWVIAKLRDQQVAMEVAFAGPLKIQQRFGALDAAAIANANPESFAELFKQTPAVHRFPGSMAARVQSLAQALLDDWGGDAAAIWTQEEPDGATVLKRLKSLPGFGDQKAKIFLALLGKQCGFGGAGWREASAPYGEEGSHRSVADITSPETLALVRESKRAAKAAAKKL